MPELYLYGPIGKGFDPFTGDEMISAKSFIKALESAAKGTVTLRINSDGGDVFEAKAMMEAIARHGKVVAEVDALAASAASFVAAAAKEVLMAPGSMMMIHSPWSFAMGNEREFRAVADRLRQVEDTVIIPAYREQGVTVGNARLKEMLADETWLDVDSAIRYGFAAGRTRENEEPIAALIRPELFNSVPDRLPHVAGPVTTPHDTIRNVQRDLEHKRSKVYWTWRAARMRTQREQRSRDLTQPPVQQ